MFEGGPTFHACDEKSVCGRVPFGKAGSEYCAGGSEKDRAKGRTLYDLVNY